MSEYPLSDTWCIWEHRNDKEDYKNNLVKIAFFNDVTTFWRIFHAIPKPSEFFYSTKRPRGLVGGRNVVSYSLFRSHIKPEWEDPYAIEGGEWRIRRFKNLAELDEIWETIILLVLGNSLEEPSNILGVRVVDSSHPSSNKAMYNVEIWFNEMEVADRVKDSIGDFIPELDTGKMYLRSHNV
tara:strand:- start:583 stop:1128 length:546 start_codon:yes stop_codon:yes gene_type:complete